jgi:hypothetical protein
MKILAVVKFNSGEALVLDKLPNLKYTKLDNRTILGRDGLFYQSYYHELPVGRFKAFAGREFDLHLTDGTVEHCHGQWWDGLTDTSKKAIGDKIIHVTANSIDNLKDCYVFYRYTSTKELYEKFRKNYKGKIYGYWEYDKKLKHEKNKNRYKKRILPIITLRGVLNGK